MSNPILGGGGFHHVTVLAKDFDASVAFYTKVLGFTPAHAWGEGPKRAAMLDTGDGNYLEIFVAADAPAQGPIIHFALRCANVRGVIERVRQAGAPVTIEPKDVDISPQMKVTVAFFKGPDGEQVELLQQR